MRQHARMSNCEHDLNGALPEGAASFGYVGTWEALDTSGVVA